jgi:hypothetical protein
MRDWVRSEERKAIVEFGNDLLNGWTSGAVVAG